LGRGALAGLPTETLIDLSCEVDGVLCLICKASKLSKELERKMATLMSRSWKSTANGAIDEGLGKLIAGKVTPKRLNAFLAGMGVKLKTPLTKAQIASLEKRLKAIWVDSKRLAAREAKGVFEFALRDTRAIAAINRHQVFWVGDFYGEQLSTRISAVTKKVMLESGLSAQEGGQALRRVLRREFGITPGGKTGIAPGFPARYAGNPESYFEGLASTTSHQSRTFGRVVAFDEAGITRYKLINPQDQRTGQVCQQLAGQVFTVATGVKHMNKVLGAKKPEDVKKIAPWLSGKQIGIELGRAKPGSAAATARLEAAGAVLPPFHFRCRTEVVVLT
jgi:hypothetical protein